MSFQTNIMADSNDHDHPDRWITRLYSRSTDPHWNGTGFWVFPILHHHAFTTHASPLLLVDLMPPTKFTAMPLGDKRRGMKEHPHVGYDTVTWVFQGQVEIEEDCTLRRDNNDNEHDSRKRTVLNPGDISWTSGPVIHAERHGPDFHQAGGTMELLEIWFQTPAEYQCWSSSRQTFSAHTLPTVPVYAFQNHPNPNQNTNTRYHPSESSSSDNHTHAPMLVGNAQILAGTYYYQQQLAQTNNITRVHGGPAHTLSPVQWWNCEMQQHPVMNDNGGGGSDDRQEPYWIDMLFPRNQVAMILVRRGRVGLVQQSNRNNDDTMRSVTIIGGPAPPANNSGGTEDDVDDAAPSSSDSTTTLPQAIRTTDNNTTTNQLGLREVGPQEMAVFDPLPLSTEDANDPTTPAMSQSDSTILEEELDTLHMCILEADTAFVVLGGHALTDQPVLGQGPFLLSCWQDLSRALTDFPQRTGIFAADDDDDDGSSNNNLNNT